MSSKNTRRHFLKTSLLASAGLASVCIPAYSAEPFGRKGNPRLPLSIAAYSFRDYLTGKEAGREFTLFDFIDYCVEQGCQGAELTSYYFPKELNTDFLLKVKRHAFLRGVEISGSAVGNTFTLPKGSKQDQEIKSVKEWIDHCTVLGAPHLRVFAGDKGKLSQNEAKKLCIDALEECCDYAAQKGVFLGIENHGGIVAEADELLSIVQEVKSPWLGINLDTGNFHTADPYADMAKCAPYAVNVQLKLEVKARGKSVEPMDFKRVSQILRQANYQGYVALEYESKEDPFKAIPGALKELKAAMAA